MLCVPPSSLEPSREGLLFLMYPIPSYYLSKHYTAGYVPYSPPSSSSSAVGLAVGYSPPLFSPLTIATVGD